MPSAAPGPVHGYRRRGDLTAAGVDFAHSAPEWRRRSACLTAPLAFDFVRSAYSRLDEQDWQFANGLLDEMAEEGRKVLESSGLSAREISYQRTADMRYVGQGHEVSVALPDGVLSAEHLAADLGLPSTRLTEWSIRPQRTGCAAGNDQLASGGERPAAGDEFQIVARFGRAVATCAKVRAALTFPNADGLRGYGGI